MGITTKSENGKCIITSVKTGSAAAETGLSVHDEIIAINGWRIEEEVNTSLPGYEEGETIEVVYARKGKMHTTNVTLRKSSSVNYTITELDTLSEDQKKYHSLWLD